MVKPNIVTREQHQACKELHERIFVAERESRGLISREKTFQTACGPKPCTFKKTCINHERLWDSQAPAERQALNDYKNGVAGIHGRAA